MIAHKPVVPVVCCGGEHRLVSRAFNWETRLLVNPLHLHRVVWHVIRLFLVRSRRQSEDILGDYQVLLCTRIIMAVCYFWQRQRDPSHVEYQILKKNMNSVFNPTFSPWYKIGEPSYLSKKKLMTFKMHRYQRGINR